ncbi:MAG: hypothetical protein LBM94_05610 [Propionibacteriaceae bacterium]|jgi:hypothetical protein|nr:hypothetical protein [Propionibacteriaceae bacterium]
MSSEDYPQEPSGVPGIEPVGDVSDVASGIVSGGDAVEANTSAPTEAEVRSEVTDAPAPDGEPVPFVTSDTDIPADHVGAPDPNAPFDPLAAAAAATQQTWVPATPVDALPSGTATAPAKAPKKVTKVGVIINAVCIVVAVIVVVGGVLWNNSSKPITTAAFKRAAAELSGTGPTGIGTFENFSVSNGVQDCAAFTGLNEKMKDGQEASPGFDSDSAMLLIRFLEGDDAVAFASGTFDCLEQSGFIDLAETTAKVTTAFGLLGKVQVWETVTTETDYEMTIHSAVYRNVVAWNVDWNPLTTPISFDDWKAWATTTFRDAIDDARNP